MKKVWVAVLAIILIGFAAWVFLSGNQTPPASSRLTLPDGSAIRIVATTFGTNHVVGTRLQRIAISLPIKLQDFMNDYLNIHINQAVMKMTTPKPELVVWIEQQPNTTNPPATINSSIYAFISGSNHFTSGTEVGLAYPGMPITYPLVFDIFPRREPVLSLNFFQRKYSDGSVTNCSSLSFTNPVHLVYPQWQPENLPATKSAGDVEVILENLETGHDQNQSTVRRDDGRVVTVYGTARKDGQNGTALALKFRPLQNSNEVWQAVSTILSDATGNIAQSSGTSWGNNSSFLFTPSLWPDEAAWKIKLEVKRTEGFRPEEIITFKNVPLGELDRTNSIGWITNVNGISVTLQSIYRHPPKTNDAWSTSEASDVHITLMGLGAGTQLDLVRMVCDTGKTNHADGWSSSGNERNYFFRDFPEGSKTGDFIFVLQQSRTVEFTVKPKLPVTDSAGKNLGH